MNANNPTTKLNTQSLPRLKFHEWDTLSTQLAMYLRTLLERYQLKNVVNVLELPSIMDLSAHFDCCEMDIFDALFELKEQAYRYEIHGLDGCIKLCDPLCRKSGNLKTEKAWQALFKPFYPFRYGVPHPAA